MVRPVIRSCIAAACLVAAMLGGAPPAAASDVSVVLTAAGPGPVTHSGGQAATACPLTVAENADGVAVLDAAVAAGCIGSYSTVTFGEFGRFLDCIDGVCAGGDPAGAGCWFWAMHENGLPTAYGVDGFRAADGDVLSFLLEPYGAAALGC